MGFFDRIRGYAGTPPSDGLDAELNDWAIVTAESEELGPALFRIRVRRPPLPDMASFATAVYLIWPYSTSDGMPDEHTRMAQEEFEIAIDDLTGTNGYAELVRVATGRNRKEWLFYVTDIAMFNEQLHRALAGKPRYPVEVTSAADPQWSDWTEFVDLVKASGQL